MTRGGELASGLLCSTSAMLRAIDTGPTAVRVPEAVLKSIVQTPYAVEFGGVCVDENNSQLMSLAELHQGRCPQCLVYQLTATN